jgi:hypothetical protein
VSRVGRAFHSARAGNRAAAWCHRRRDPILKSPLPRL